MDLRLILSIATLRSQTFRENQVMAAFVKVFAFVLFVYVASALPVNDDAQDQTAVDLLALESESDPQQKTASSIIDNVTRQKRHYGELEI